MSVAAMSIRQAAMDASQCRTQRMPSSCQSAMYTMHMMAASTLIIGTGALASVSLFVVVLLVVSLLLVGLVVVISLLLTCLTGPNSLEGLVGQTKVMAGLATHMTRGE